MAAEWQARPGGPCRWSAVGLCVAPWTAEALDHR
jgi:hypothetical protein